MRDVTEMVEIWVVYTDSVVISICYEYTTNVISSELMRGNYLNCSLFNPQPPITLR